MAPISAGLLMWKRIPGEAGIRVFLIHPGGPFFTNKDNGYWGIPKGIAEKGEDYLEAAVREFHEEVGLISNGPYLQLGQIRQRSGKIVHAWAFEVEPELDVIVKSNTFSMEWPHGSGRFVVVPEADRGEFFDIDSAKRKINQAQAEFIDRLLEILSRRENAVR